MPSIIKKSEVARLLPRRDPSSHKGQNGRVLIIGGSIDYFGAPLLSGLGALGSGADLVYLLVPDCNFEVSRSFYPDFIVRKYAGNYVNSRTYDLALEFLDRVDCILMGPGMGEDPESLRVVTRILEKTSCQVVLDADALPAIANLGLPAETRARFTITPHAQEMAEVIEMPLPDEPSERIRIVEDFARRWSVTILLKGQRDLIVSPGCETRINETGNAGMTVGGSGDVLAGCLASLIAQHAHPYDAAIAAAYVVGAAGDSLYESKGFNFIATDIAQELPYTIKNIIG